MQISFKGLEPYLFAIKTLLKNIIKGYKSSDNKPRVKVMFRESEHGHSDVSEYEIFCEEVEQLKQLLSSVPGV
jgi:hypothetical protein